MSTQFLSCLLQATTAQMQVNMLNTSEAGFKPNQAGFIMVSSVFN
jgi:hypothetical protein